MDFSAWSPMRAKRLIAPTLILSISILLSGCVTKHPPKPAVTEEYKLGHADGYNAAIDHPHDLINRMIDFTNYSYHTNLRLPEAEQKKILHLPWQIESRSKVRTACGGSANTIFVDCRLKLTYNNYTLKDSC